MDYDVYVLTKKEAIRVGMMLYFSFSFIIFIFYQNLILSFILGSAGLIYMKAYKENEIKKRKDQMLRQFKDMLYSLNVALETGDVVSNAFKTAYYELSNIYHEEDYIMIELKQILMLSELNHKIEDLLINFAKRTNIEDILNFAEVFYICSKAGGNLVKVLKQTTEVITEKMELEQEIKTLFSQKEFEIKILIATPILIFLTLSLIAGEYIKPLHSTLMGYVVITISIAIIIFASFISNKMIRIEV